MPKNEEILSFVGESRRGFVRKVIVGTAFVTPLIASFSMDSHKAAAAGYSLNSNQTVQGITACFKQFSVDHNLFGLVKCVIGEIL
jgi:hypothetical protein